MNNIASDYKLEVGRPENEANQAPCFVACSSVYELMKTGWGAENEAKTKLCP